MSKLSTLAAQSEAGFEGRPDVQEALTVAQSLAVTYPVTTAAEYTRAGNSLQDCKAAIRRLEDVRTSLTQPINAALKKVNAFFAGPMDDLKRTESYLKVSMTAFKAEEERLRREEQKRIDDAAAEERRKREAEAEATRKRAREAAEKIEREAAEKRALEERARKEAEAAERKAAAAKTAKAREEAEAKAAVARAAEQKAAAAAETLTNKAEARMEKAEAKAEMLEQQAEAIQAPVVATVKAEAAGISQRVTWRAEVVDLMILVKAVAAGQAPLSLITVDQTVLRSIVQSRKAETDIPGVRAWADTSIVARS
jgi:membrane protein involved in colicin uptake